MARTNSRLGLALERLAAAVTQWTGSTSAFTLACAIVIVWLLSGRFFRYSDTWQLVINTGTTIVTFLMVFLIQRSQNKDSLALHLNLNEPELTLLHRHYARLAAMAKHDLTLTKSHSIEEAELRHRRKIGQKS